jgi:methylenetetrahydrofolate--tRNA-(uracil-5-)-methyltransferase
MSGVEGYVESAASGLLAGLNAAALASGRSIASPPRTTAIGALAFYVSHADPAHYDPTNITFGIIEPLARPPKSKAGRKLALSERALADLQQWMASRQLPVSAGDEPDSAALASSGQVGADDSRG